MNASTPVTTTLPSGDWIYLSRPLESTQTTGLICLVVISCLSLLAVIGLLSVIAISAFNTRSSIDQHLFVRTNVAAYFISLLLCDLLQALGSILNLEWIQTHAVTIGGTCTLQAVLKQASDVGTAIWTLIIALHTFCLLVFEWKMGRVVLWTVLVGGWSLLATIVIAGPAAQDTAKRGPFFSISGYWCWISPTFPGARITLDYMIMFMSALLSLVLYVLMYLRLRGNLKVTGRRMEFSFKSPSPGTGFTGDQAMKIAKQMLMYPVAYIVLILPIAASRFSDWSGRPVPFGVTIFSAAVFLCSGIVNVVLFGSTRRILPPESITFRINKLAISKPKPMRIPHRLEEGLQDTYRGDEKMVNVDLSNDEKASYHSRSQSGSSTTSHQTSLSRDFIVPLSPHIEHPTAAPMNTGSAYGGFTQAVPQDVRESTLSFDHRQTQQYPHPPPTARTDSRRSEVDSMYDYYGARESTLTDYAQYSQGQTFPEPFPQELATKRFDQNQ